MRIQIERWDGAVQDLTEAKTLMLELEAKGDHYMDGDDSAGIQRRIDRVLVMKKQGQW